MTLLSTALYREAPRTPAIIVAGGVEMVRNRLVKVNLTTRDFITGFNNVSEMKVWGDIDPNFRPERYGADEGDSAWVPFEAYFALVIEGTDASVSKSIHAKIRNVSGVETAELSAVFSLDASPHPTVLWTDERRVPPIDGVFQFGWSSSHDFDSMALALAPFDEAGFEQCKVLVADETPGIAGEHRTVTVQGSDLMAADLTPTQSGAKLMRLFISVDGTWYSSW